MIIIGKDWGQSTSDKFENLMCVLIFMVCSLFTCRAAETARYSRQVTMECFGPVRELYSINWSKSTIKYFTCKTPEGHKSWSDLVVEGKKPNVISLPFVVPLFASSNFDLSNLHFSLKLLSIPEMQVCNITLRYTVYIASIATECKEGFTRWS